MTSFFASHKNPTLRLAFKPSIIRPTVLVQALLFLFMSLPMGLMTSHLWARTFTVNKEELGGKCDDRNIGSTDAPWCTIARANRSLQPGDKVYIREGTYNEVISPTSSGQPGLPIIYQAHPGERPIIIGKPGVPAVVNIGGLRTDWKPKSYIIVDGLKIKRGFPDSIDKNPHFLISIYGSKSTHNVIRNCIIEGTDETLLKTWKEGYRINVGGISIRKSSYNRIDKNSILNMTFIGVLIDGSDARFNVIHGNRIKDMIRDGIHMGSKDADTTIRGILIENNEIHGSLMSDGIQANGCYEAGSKHKCTAVSGVIVRNNVIYDNAENNIDLKGASHWVIENNRLFQSYGNNDGGLKARPGEGCRKPPCNNTMGGSNISKGSRRYSRDIIIRNNIIYDGCGGVYIGDGYRVYNNTILNNRRTHAGPSKPFCIFSRCSRKPPFAGVYGSGNDASIINNIIGNNGFAVSRAHSARWHIDHNVYFWDRKLPFKGLASFFVNGIWHAFTLNAWQENLHNNENVTGNDKHSLVLDNPERLFNGASPLPVGTDENIDFTLIRPSPIIDTGSALTKTLTKGSGQKLILEDARFFSDGYGVTQGDTILIGTNKPVMILNIEHGKNAIRVSSPMNWELEDPVNLSTLGHIPGIGCQIQ